MLDFILGTKAKRQVILRVVIIVAVALFVLVMANFLFSTDTSFSRLLNWVNPDRYQAIFLSNNQVYFGKVTDVNKDTLVLENIYYLRVSQDLQAGEGETSPDFSLVKLGNEVHGPEDRMNINLEHILFVEDLKIDSKVMQAIRGE